jgi:malate dehydrogenase
MSVHIAVVGNGRIGRPTAYTVFREMIADEFSLVDTEKGKAWAFGEELHHVAASLNYDVDIKAYEFDEGVEDADLIVVCPGKPRIPGIKMDRRELVGENAKIINHVAEVMPPRNPDARWVIVTNPVDAMATLFKKVSGEDFVISTGDHPDTLRFRTKLARDLKVPVSEIEGFVGGEHGSAAHPLWSTAKIKDLKMEDYMGEKDLRVDKGAVTDYVRGISKKVVDIIGGTEVGPAAGFRDIITSIIGDKRRVYSIADSVKFPSLPEPVNLSIPTHVGKKIGPNLWDELLEEEKKNIEEAAKAIYSNYRMALEAVGRG